MKMLSKIKGVFASAVAGALSVFSSVASAALPSEATTAFATITTDVGELIGLAWPVVALVTGAFIAIKLFKRFSRSAT